MSQQIKPLSSFGVYFVSVVFMSPHFSHFVQFAGSSNGIRYQTKQRKMT